MARANPFQFVQQVRAEAAKVVWPTRARRLITTGMVFVMATLAAIFFFLVDQLIGLGVEQILRIGG
jgi:preprotein translocase subunit SecE